MCILSAIKGSNRSPAILFFVVAFSASAVRCNAQDVRSSPPFTVDAGGGLAPVFGNYSRGLSWPKYDLSGGFGVAVYRPDIEYDTNGKSVSTQRWSIYLTANFMFNQASIANGVAVQTAGSNPQIPTLLSATGGRAKFFSATLDPTFRYPAKGRLKPYAYAGYGWLRRQIQLTGVSIQGPLYQPSGPVVGKTGGNSGAVSFGGGVDVGQLHALGGMMLFAEARFLHGLGINSGTTFAPTFGVRW